MIDYEIFEKVKSIQKKMAEVIDELNSLGDAKEHLFETLVDGSSQSIREAEIAIDSLPTSSGEIKNMLPESRIALFEAEDSLASHGDCRAMSVIEQHLDIINDAFDELANDSKDARVEIKKYIDSGFALSEIIDYIVIAEDRELAEYLLASYGRTDLEGECDTLRELLDSDNSPR